ncbi:DNA polymerase III subunit chi [Thetidibacter halocola]|uniref:DNA polymerase III subunit chi n=1 Tax=Thetidibacter halocola TaxID=2827239 RepID=A0A8J7WD26_9RHOB|nr:DNA polymerase III subunit chi [Thetidibacter halocola]
MGAVYFYHLTRQPVEVTLPMLLDKSLAAGWRVAVRGTDPARMDWLDQKLWLGPEEQFLPHGLAGGDHDADQPVLLTVGPGEANNPACLMAIDGAEVSVDEVQRLERVCILFDGHDDSALGVARAQWKALTGAGCRALYWSEESGRWQKLRETGGD